MPDYLILAQAIAHFLEYTEVQLGDCPALRACCTPQYFTHMVAAEQTDAQQQLGRIAAILDSDLSDFNCIDALVSAFHAMGYEISRHDFG